MPETKINNEEKTKLQSSNIKPFVESKRLWWIATTILLITIGRDFLISPPQWSDLNDHFSAIGFFLWVTFSLGILLYEKYKQSKLQISDFIIAGATLALAFIPVWRTEEVVCVFAILLTIGLLISTLLSYKKSYLIEGTLLGGVIRFLLTIIKGFQGIGASFQSVKNGTEKGQRRRTIISILVGLLLSLPWIFIFLALFSSADKVFQTRLEQLFEIISLELILRIFGNLFWLVVFAVLLFGFFYNLKNEEFKIKKPTILGNIETLIILSMVVLIFFSFIMVQFRYFFAGETAINVDGYTYAEYARRGTSELLFASGLAIAMLQLLKFFKKESSPTSNKIFKALFGVLIAEIGIVLVSAYQRLRLLENTYGVTSIRIMGHVLMITMAIFLVAFLIDELFSKKNHLLLLLSSWAIVFVITLAVINMPVMAVRTNQTVHGDAGIDWHYLRNLPDEGIPALIEFIKSEDFNTTQMGNQSNQAEYEKLLAEMSCREFELTKIAGTGWQNSRWYWRIDQIKAMNAILDNNQLWEDKPVQINYDECINYYDKKECQSNDLLSDQDGYSPWNLYYVELENIDEKALQEELEFYEEDSYYKSLTEEELEPYIQSVIQDHTRYYCDFYDYRGW